MRLEWRLAVLVGVEENGNLVDCCWSVYSQRSGAFGLQRKWVLRAKFCGRTLRNELLDWANRKGHSIEKVARAQAPAWSYPYAEMKGLNDGGQDRLLKQYWFACLGRGCLARCRRSMAGGEEGRSAESFIHNTRGRACIRRGRG